MTYAAQETSRYAGQPFELYWFATNTLNAYLTSGDESRAYLGNTYTPEAIERTEVDFNQELQSQSITVRLPIDSVIAQQFVSYIPSSPMSLVIFRGHETDGAGEVVTYFTGRVSAARFDEVCELTVLPEQALLKRQVPGPRYQSQCNWVWGSPACGVNKGTYAVTAVVTAIAGSNGDTITAAALGAQTSGYFTAGWIERGDERRMIILHTGSTAQLITPMPSLQVGDTITIYPGCQRTASDCRNKFGNYQHFSGFDRVPGRNPFQGSLI